MKTNKQPRTKMVLICLLHITAATAALNASQRATAMVNVREGSFAQTSLDLDRTKDHAELKIERTYNSRSSYSGLFGFGWCSSLETSLRHVPQGKIALQECGSSSEVVFETSVLKPGQWLALNSPGDRLLASPGRLSRRNAQGEVQVFSDLTGRLLNVTDNAGKTLELRYSSEGRLLEVGPPGKNLLRFVYDTDASNRVVRVDSPGHTSIQYRYRGADLVAVDGSGLLTYDYDDLHNLTRIKAGSHVSDEITYDKEQDRVVRATQITFNERCTEAFAYRPRKAHLYVEAQSYCGNAKPLQKSFEFWYGGDSPTTRFLAKMRVESEHRFTELSFDARFGKPIAINRDGTVTLLADAKELQ